MNNLCIQNLLFLLCFLANFNDFAKKAQKMFSLKNNKLKDLVGLELCKTHNDKTASKSKIKLLMHKSRNYLKDFHPLKNKKVRKRKKFLNNRLCLSNLNLSGFNECEILSKKYVANLKKKEETVWADEKGVMNWLKGCGIKVKKMSSGKYLVRGRECSLSQLLVFTNKKRREKKEPLFFLDGLTEY